MKKTMLTGIICALAVMFLLTGCSTSSGGNIVTEYRTGTQGLEISFMTNSPPGTVYAEDGSFPVNVEVRNRGVYPGEGDGSLNAELYFLGFDTDIITGLTSEEVTFEEEEAKTRFNPEGGLTAISSTATIDPDFFTDARIDNYGANIAAVLCYPYKTFASADVCIDPNPNRNSQLDSCAPGISGTGSQGAPIAVTSVESIAQRGKARFVVTISNAGGGQVIRESELDRCTDVELDLEDMDKITVTEVQLSNGIQLECTPEGDISLIGGSATIFCKAEGLDDTQPAYQSVLQIELSYGYKTSVQTSVQIRGE